MVSPAPRETRKPQSAWTFVSVRYLYSTEREKLEHIKAELAILDKTEKEYLRSREPVELKDLVETILSIKGFPLEVYGLRGVEEAIVTAGGVDVNEVNPRTMESKIVPGLYFAGEVLDLDGYTGGFNLQIAWSTAVCAGSAV